MYRQTFTLEPLLPIVPCAPLPEPAVAPEVAKALQKKIQAREAAMRQRERKKLMVLTSAGAVKNPKNPIASGVYSGPDFIRSKGRGRPRKERTSQALEAKGKIRSRQQLKTGSAAKKPLQASNQQIVCEKSKGEVLMTADAGIETTSSGNDTMVEVLLSLRSGKR